MAISLTLTDQLFFTGTPNFFHNFAGGGSSTFSSKFAVTYAPNPNIAIGIETNVQIADDNGFDYTIKPSGTIYF